MKTLLERARGAELDIIVDSQVPVSTMALLSSNTQQMRSFSFSCNEWTIIQRFSQVISGPLPLLRALTIDTLHLDGFDATLLHHQRLFSNVVNLRVLRFHSKSLCSPSFTRFDFPNLVTFDFSTKPSQWFLASRLFDFLEASPNLRTVVMAIIGRISFEDVPRERIVVLPDVESFSLTMSDGGRGYEIAAYISCPSARFTMLMHTIHCYTVPEEIFPTSVSWNAIVHQYTRSPVEEVTLELKIALAIVCKLTFRSSDETVIQLCFKVVEDDNGFCLLSQEMQNEILTQSTRTVWWHPQLANIKRLWICHSFRFICSPEDSHITDEIGRLFRSVAPLCQGCKACLLLGS